MLGWRGRSTPLADEAKTARALKNRTKGGPCDHGGGVRVDLELGVNTPTWLPAEPGTLDAGAMSDSYHYVNYLGFCSDSGSLRYQGQAGGAAGWSAVRALVFAGRV